MVPVKRTQLSDRNVKPTAVCCVKVLLLYFFLIIWRVFSVLSQAAFRGPIWGVTGAIKNYLNILVIYRILIFCTNKTNVFLPQFHPLLLLPVTKSLRMMSHPVWNNCHCAPQEVNFPRTVRSSRWGSVSSVWLRYCWYNRKSHHEDSPTWHCCRTGIQWLCLVTACLHQHIS